MSRSRNIFTSDLKPAYAYGIVLVLLLIAFLLAYFLGIEKLFAVKPWDSLVRSLAHSGPSSAAKNEDTVEQVGSPRAGNGESSKEHDSARVLRGTDSSTVRAGKSDRELSGLLPGRWRGGAVMHDNLTNKKVEFDTCNTLYSDGRFVSVTHVSDGRILNFSGKWRVASGGIVWETLASNEPSFRQPFTETNSIIELTNSMLVLQERGFQSKWTKE